MLVERERPGSIQGNLSGPTLIRVQLESVPVSLDLASAAKACRRHLGSKSVERGPAGGTSAGCGVDRREQGGSTSRSLSAEIGIGSKSVKTLRSRGWGLLRRLVAGDREAKGRGGNGGGGEGRRGRRPDEGD